MEKEHLQYHDADVGLILKCILKTQNKRLWTEIIWLGIGTTGSSSYIHLFKKEFKHVCIQHKK